MPGQLESSVPLAPDYHARKADAKAAIKSLLGKEVVVKHKNKSIAYFPFGATKLFFKSKQTLAFTPRLTLRSN